MNPIRPLLLASIAGATSLLTGCVSMSGLADAERGFACKAPAGSSCKSVSGVYANSRATTPPGTPNPTTAESAPQGPRDDRAAAALASAAPTGQQLPVAMPGVPIRSQPRTMRIWMAPWVDEDGDLHDQTYLYVVVNSGKWMVDNTREATVQRTLSRLRPPTISAASRTTGPTADERAQQAANDVADSGAALGAKE
jgi:conjugal transfer pilus assembly protein TraV